MKSVRMGAQDLLGVPLTIDAPQERPLVITIGTDDAAIDGQVVNVRREPAANATVVLIPDIPLRTRIDLYRTFITDREGRFTARAVPPGSYTLLAWEIVEDGRWADPEFIGLHEGRGTALRLDANSKTSVVLRVIESIP